jgi:hypothetical protein
MRVHRPLRPLVQSEFVWHAPDPGVVPAVGPMLGAAPVAIGQAFAVAR